MVQPAGASNCLQTQLPKSHPRLIRENERTRLRPRHKWYMYMCVILFVGRLRLR